MRNIYDIIEENKNSAYMTVEFYEIAYLSEQLSNIDGMEYVQEGVGGAIKKGVTAVVNVIKALIKKIKEIVGKIVGFFTKADDEVSNLEKKIQDANDGKNSDDEPKEEKKEENKPVPKAADVKDKLEKRAEKKEEKKGPHSKANNLLDVLKQSTLIVKETYHFWPLENYVKTMQEIINSIEGHILEGSDDKEYTGLYLDQDVEKDVFDYRGNFVNGVDKYFKKDAEAGKTKNLNISWNAKTIYDFVKDGRKSIKHFKQIEQNAEARLNSLIRTVTNSSDKNEESRLIALVNKGVNMISYSVGAFSSVVTKAVSTYIAICRRVTNDYCAAHR